MKTAALSVATAFVLLICLVGCERTTEPDFTVMLDWESWVHQEQGQRYGGVSLGASGPGPTHGLAGTKVIEGEEHFGQQMKAGNSGEKTVEFYARPIESERQGVRIYLRTNGVVKLKLYGFPCGVLRDVDAGRQYTPPFVLQPGEYHLEAVENVDPAASRPTTDPAPAAALQEHTDARRGAGRDSR